MVFTKEGFLSGIIAAVAGVGAFIGIEVLMGDFINKWSLALLIIGVLLIVFAAKIKQSIELNQTISKTLGAILLFLGLRPFLIKYVASTKVAIFTLAISLIILAYRDVISEKLIQMNGG